MEESTHVFRSAESITTATFDRRNLFCEIVATVFVPDLDEKVGMVGSVASSMPLKNRLIFGHSLFAVDPIQPVVIGHALPPVHSGLFPNMF